MPYISLSILQIIHIPRASQPTLQLQLSTKNRGCNSKEGIGGYSSTSLRDGESTSEASFHTEDFSPTKICSKSS